MASFISLVMASTAFAGGHINWSEVETKAKEEGEVFWFNWYLEEPLQNFAKRFEDEYGIKVTVPAGENQINLDKVVAEKDRAKGDVDVLSIGFNRVPDLAMDDLFIKLADSLPADENRTPEMAGIDGLGYAYAFWGNQSGIAYDPEFVAEADLPQTPAEFQAFWNNNPLIQYIIVFFMFLAGTNFVLSYFAIKGKIFKALQDDEFKWYSFFIVSFSILVAILLYFKADFSQSEIAHPQVLGKVESFIRHSLFQVVAIITTTGFVTADYTKWMPLLTITFFGLMFLGGSSGSTSGGLR